MWLALHFPHLTLEVFARTLADPALPLLVSDAHGSRQWVHARNRAAARAGVVPGMSLGAAQALLSAHRTLARDPAAEQKALENLAAWAGQFTSRVCLVPPQDLLLEIGGSLLLFGGLDPLRQRISTGLADLGYRARDAVAPVPLAATLLTRAGHTVAVPDKSALRQVLGALPVTRLGLPDATVAALRGMGLQRLDDCLRLPRAGLARRLGPDTLAYLLRALGELPDPRPAYQCPARFESRIVLAAEVENTEPLLFVARRQLYELAGFLRSHGAGVQRLAFALGHRQRPPTPLNLGLLAPCRDAGHLLGLLRAQLERIQLPAPVDELVLIATETAPLADEDGALFAEGRPSAPQGERLLESLQARLGTEAVFGCAVVADHRPEHASQRCIPGTASLTQARFGTRPLWLLTVPEPLDAEAGIPCHHGKLKLIGGPERIESGWWDAVPVMRDYYVAEDPRHTRLWIFRERHGAQTWFLHGIFA